jgi:hypothetical protein
VKRVEVDMGPSDKRFGDEHGRAAGGGGGRRSNKERARVGKLCVREIGRKIVGDTGWRAAEMF